MASPFSSAEVMRHRDGVHAPRVIFENGVLTMMGRKIPVVSAGQLEARLRQIGCGEEVVEEIVGGIFGYSVPLATFFDRSHQSDGHDFDSRPELCQVRPE